SLPFLVILNYQGHPVVLILGTVHTMGCHLWIAVTHPAPISSIHRNVRNWLTNDRQACFHLSYFNKLSFAGSIFIFQRAQKCIGRIKTGYKLRNTLNNNNSSIIITLYYTYV